MEHRLHRLHRPHRPTIFARGRPVAALIACGAVLLTAGSLRADPKADYASLFGEEEKKVLSTATTPPSPPDSSVDWLTKELIRRAPR